MMTVTIEVHPGGDSSRARVIERLYVWNISALADVSDYLYDVVDPRSGDWPVPPLGRINGHRRADGAWELVRRVIQDMEGER